MTHLIKIFKSSLHEIRSCTWTAFECFFHFDLVCLIKSSMLWLIYFTTTFTSNTQFLVLWFHQSRQIFLRENLSFSICFVCVTTFLKVCIRVIRFSLFKRYRTCSNYAWFWSFISSNNWKRKFIAIFVIINASNFTWVTGFAFNWYVVFLRFILNLISAFANIFASEQQAFWHFNVLLY